IALDRGGDVQLWEVASGKTRGRFTGHRGRVWSISFAQDGRRLASGSADHTAIIWDITGRLRDGRLPAVELSAKELDGLWADLAREDAIRAHRAIWALSAAAKDAVPVLRKQVQPASGVDEKRIAKLIGDLDSDTFSVREKASEELAALGEAAEPAIRKALQGEPTLELRRRAEALLAKIKERVRAPQQLRPLRAIEVLEHIGTAEAREVLQTLAKGAAGAELTQQAQAALNRLSTRAAHSR